VPGRLEGRVAFITGAARGQGRSHALRLAEEGADIIAIDLCGPVEGVVIPMATPEDLAETVAQVEKLDRRIIATQADVRDLDALKGAVDDGVSQLGRLDIVVANAGIGSTGDRTDRMDRKIWQDTVDINMTGVWLTAKVAIPLAHTADGLHQHPMVCASAPGPVRTPTRNGQTGPLRPS
jgi:NAD(P)-dependent dehydrogenase (short-subunit alcohol dehydrogenase family)